LFMLVELDVLVEACDPVFCCWLFLFGFGNIGLFGVFGVLFVIFKLLMKFVSALITWAKKLFAFSS
jgi:hypothetical protein